MKVVYFKTESAPPSGLLTTDRINYSALGDEFELDLVSIELNEIRFPKETLWEVIEDFFKKSGVPVGAKEDPVIVSGKPRVHGGSTDVVRDRSEEWNKLVLLPKLPELPRNKAELTNVLLPPGHIQKLPVTKEFYKCHVVRWHGWVEEHLIEADGSQLCIDLSHFLGVHR